MGSSSSLTVARDGGAVQTRKREPLLRFEDILPGVSAPRMDEPRLETVKKRRRESRRENAKTKGLVSEPYHARPHHRLRTQPLLKSLGIRLPKEAPPAPTIPPGLQAPYVQKLPQLLIDSEDSPCLLDRPAFRKRFMALLHGPNFQREVKLLAAPYHPKLTRLLSALLPTSGVELPVAIGNLRLLSKFVAPAPAALRAAGTGLFLTASAALTGRLQEALTGRLQEALQERPDDRAVSAFLWSFANLRLCPEQQLLRALFDSLEPRLEAFAPLSLVTLLWSFAKLGVALPESFCQALLAPLAANVAALDAQGVSNAFSALGKIKPAIPEQVMEALCAQAAAKIEDFSAQSLTDTLVAFARLGVTPPPLLLKKLSQHAAERASRFPTASIAQFLGALSALQVKPHRRLVEEMTLAIESKAAKWQPGQLKALSSSLKQLGVPVPSFMKGPKDLLSVHRRLQLR